jgi:hypothetical protein
MGFPWIRKEKLLPILVSRAVVFFLSMSVLTLFLYAAGTVQGFIDSTQIVLLRLYVILGISLSVFSFAGMILNLRRFFILKKPRYLFRAGGYLLLVVFGIVTVLLSLFIIAISGGNAGS